MLSTTSSPSSFKPLTAVLDMNNQASKLIISGEYASAITVLVQALSLFKQFVATWHHHNTDEDEEEAATPPQGLQQTLPFKAEVRLTDYTHQNLDDCGLEPFLIQQPFNLVVISDENDTPSECGGQAAVRNEVSTTSTELFHSVSLAVIVNMAICYQAHAMKYPKDKNNNLQKAVQLYRHACKLLGAGLPINGTTM